MADELNSSVDAEEVLSPRPDPPVPDKLEQYMKSISESLQLNAMSFKVLADAASSKSSKKRNKKRKNSPENPSAGDPPEPSADNSSRKRAKRAQTSSSSSSVLDTNNNVSAALPPAESASQDQPDSSDGESPDFQTGGNALRKGLSRQNASKGKSISSTGRGQVEVTADPQDFDHEEQFSALGDLERSLLHEEVSDLDPDSVGSQSLPILGGVPPPTWTPNEQVLNWYLKVADIDLKGEDFQKISSAYETTDTLSEHFSPPKLPDPIWRNLKTMLGQPNHHRALFHTQEYLFTALKPLLSLLEENTSSPDSRDKLTTAIQLICSSNLQLNRYRRALAGSSINKDLRSSVMGLPVTHNNLFGEDFHKSIDEVVKLQATTSKAIVPYTPASRKPTRFPTYQPTQSYRQPNRYHPGHSAPRPFRGTPQRGQPGYYPSRRSFRGRSRGRGSRGPRSSY